MNMELPPIKNREHNPESVSTIDCGLTTSIESEEHYHLITCNIIKIHLNWHKMSRLQYTRRLFSYKASGALR